jgi:hypothetical protein
MSNTTHFQKVADLCRRVAAIPTSGGHQADRTLLALASKLDREAAMLDGRPNENGSTDRSASMVQPRSFSS